MSDVGLLVVSAAFGAGIGVGYTVATRAVRRRNARDSLWLLSDAAWSSLRSEVRRRPYDHEQDG